MIPNFYYPGNLGNLIFPLSWYLGHIAIFSCRQADGTGRGTAWQGGGLGAGSARGNHGH